MTMDHKFSDEQSFSSSYEIEESQKASIIEVSRMKELSVSATPRRGLDHCITAPVGAHENLLIDANEIKFSRSMTEKKTSRHDLKIDRLSDREKVIERLTRWKNLIVNLITIQMTGQ
ncbi:hypothetical protein F3Y22_tig00112496pilonHSYRG00043 [Hibiscus syriacus]|uniref:Uncharacterized protein n=1 Tax=Hibiscus syriacus TaxID=106335 RepID=A0A6A2WYE4_HIBSY|nr:hypothetical protein F3Y22_tig00112496pilonHSYRG00043 [Hibiscus syriacus]